MPRWPASEREQLAEVRERLKGPFSESPPYPEVVGDRKILRFLRGHGHNVDKVVELMGKFLRWRKEFKVDEMRRNIVEGGLDHPSKFPHGEVILRLIPQLVIAPLAFSRNGCPICVDQYKFKPDEVLRQVSLSEYLVFATYCLEFRSLVLEQLSEKREREKLASMTPEEREHEMDPFGGSKPYGVIVSTLVIRDVGAVGLDHCSEVGRNIIKAVVTLASDNYPEMMQRCYLVNVPWIFNALWYFIKGLLPETTLRKVCLCGKDFKTRLLKEVDPEFIPDLIQGPYAGGRDPKHADSVITWDVNFLVRNESIEERDKAALAASWRSKRISVMDRNLLKEAKSHKKNIIRRKQRETWKVWYSYFMHHYLATYPVWTVAVAAYCANFLFSGQWRTTLPYLLQIALVWACLLII